MSDKMKRLLLASIFISLLLILNTYHYSNHELYEAYPNNEDVIDGFEGNVSICGTVINKSPDGFTLRIRYESESKIVNVLSPVNVEGGDSVEVLGLLQRDEIITEKIIVYRQWSYYSVFIRSVIALPIVVYQFFIYLIFYFIGLKFRRRYGNA